MLFSTIAGHPFCNKHIYISQTPILLANTVHYKAMYNSDLTPGRKPPRYALIINGIFFFLNSTLITAILAHQVRTT